MLLKLGLPLLTISASGSYLKGSRSEMSGPQSYCTASHRAPSGGGSLFGELWHEGLLPYLPHFS